MVRAMTELENNVVAVERVQEYVDIESEVSRVYWRRSKYRMNMDVASEMSAVWRCQSMDRDTWTLSQSQVRYGGSN